MPFAIDDLTSVIAHWSADQIVGLSDGDPVDTMPDSVSGWDLTGTTTERPLYRPTSSINSLPAVEFQGGDDFMRTAAKALPAGNVSLSFVIRTDTVTLGVMATLATAAPATYGVSGTMIFPYVYTTAGGALDIYGRNIANTTNWRSYTGNVAALPATTSCVITLVRSALGWATRVNGVAYFAATGTTGLSEGISAASYYVGLGNAVGVSAIDGLYSEVVLTAETVSSESVYIEGVLAHKYGITLPTTHPFYAAAPTSGPPTAGASQTFHPLGGS